MPDAVPHLGVLYGNDDPFRLIENVSVFPRSRREANVSGFSGNSLTVGIGHKVSYISCRTFFLIADLITVGIVHFSLHVTPRINDLPNAATLSKSYSA